MKVKYFYDGQMQRVIKHLIRVFSNFQVQDGNDETTGEPTYRRVPCRYGDISKQSAYSLKSNSENILNSAPIMVINIDSLNMSRENVRGPVAENMVQGINSQDENGNYTNNLEGYYEVERLNPIPWDIEFSVNIWVTNQTNKFELFEQIATLFAPAVPFQLSTNPNDWSSMNYIELTDYNLSSRAWPAGSDNIDLDISTFKFKTMIWLTIPNKVSRARIIHEIVTDLKTPGLDDMQVPDLGKWDHMYDVFTPGNHKIKLVQKSTTEYDCILIPKYLSQGNKIVSWDTLIQYYSVHYNSLSLSLLSLIEDSSPILGDISNISNNVCTLTLNSLPQTTYTLVNYMINNSFDFISTIESVTSATFVNTGDEFDVDGTTFDNTKLLTYTNGEYFFTTIPEDAISFISNMNAVYKYNKETNWTPVIKEIYNEGFWNLNFL